MKSLVVGLLAHVDAGKTTLSEGLLYRSGTIQKPGRVDHADAFLDNDALERERGITIFSHQAVLPLRSRTLVLLDTPGHVDFSAETERALSVMDDAILVINATDGVQAHTETLWQLLERYHIPTFIFVNKMDLPGANREKVLEDLKKQLSDCCIAFESGAEEEISLCSEALMEEFLNTGTLSVDAVARAIAARQLFPCCFGAALRQQGVDEFLRILETYTILPAYPAEFAARVYKISRDEQGRRLTWMKLTGGELRPKTVLHGVTSANGENWEEKADQLRLCSGEKFTSLSCAEAGQICAVTGLTHTWAGEGLGAEHNAPPSNMKSVITCQLILPEGCDFRFAYAKLRDYAEEEPQLHLRWDSKTQSVFIRAMGKVQLEVLQRKISERLAVPVSFGPERILYQETISAPAEGVGHFEPLRHYAEVHLLLEPGAPGSGIVLAADCPEDVLEGHWQRLVLTHLAEREFPGVLIGAPLTDVKITLLSGRAHVKHTQGGDFREAAYRAVRMGLMRAQSVLLEPWYCFRLELPEECIGRAMSDLQRFGAVYDPPEREEGICRFSGAAPVSSLADYGQEVAAYSKGRGRFSLRPDGYRPCSDAQKIIDAVGYDPTADAENTPNSVFCSHGGGYDVKWNEVPAHMHLPWAYKPAQKAAQAPSVTIHRGGTGYTGTLAEDRELMAIYERTYGPVKERDFTPQTEHQEPNAGQVAEFYGPEETFLLVDGYNMIFSWEELRRLAKDDLDAARHRLIEMMCNYQGYKRCGLILVFDAYKVKGSGEHMEKVNNIFVVYTKEAERADTYIERTTYDLGRHYRIRVATSDGMEQRIILGHDAERISARLFLAEVTEVQREIELRVRENNARPI